MGKFSILLIFALNFLFVLSSDLSLGINSTDEFVDSYFGLLLSPILTASKKREISIYWSHTKYHQGDKIGLYVGKPRNDLKPIFTIQIHNSSGIVKTGVKADFLPSINLTFTKTCLKYHVAWLRSESIIQENCLKTEPTWMEDMKCFLGSHTLKDIFLPGTHNSVSYDTKTSLWRDFFYKKYVITQDEDILGQLIYGARYLDIRVCYTPSKEIKWWGCHEFVKTNPLKEIIDDVKTFLNNTNEIVIFDVQEFCEEFKEDRSVHDKFINFLKTEFADYAIPYIGWSSDLNQLWTSKKKLIIGYDNGDFVFRHRILWPSVNHQWGNVQSINDLFQFLKRIEEHSVRGESRVSPRSAMAELTPTTWYIVKNILGGLREMTEVVNPKVTEWYNEIWQYSANVVSVDFLRSSGIVSTALKWNSRRFNSSCQK